MEQLMMQKQLFTKLDHMDKKINHILEYLEDSRLTAEEKQILQESHQHEKEGKLISSKELAKKLRL